MRMRPVEGGVVIPAGALVEFAPGGLHGMLMGLDEDLFAGRTYAATLTFEHTGEVQIEVEVRAP